jgi:hypothetical protein
VETLPYGFTAVTVKFCMTPAPVSDDKPLTTGTTCEGIVDPDKNNDRPASWARSGNEYFRGPVRPGD